MLHHRNSSFGRGDAVDAETIDRQYAEILKLSRNTEALNRQIRNKNEEIAKLKARLAKYEDPDKNSGKFLR